MNEQLVSKELVVTQISRMLVNGNLSDSRGY